MRGKAGREWAINNGFSLNGMRDAFIESVETCFKNWTPKKKFTLTNTSDPSPVYPDGIIFDSII